MSRALIFHRLVSRHILTAFIILVALIAARFAPARAPMGSPAPLALLTPQMAQAQEGNQKEGSQDISRDDQTSPDTTQSIPSATAHLRRANFAGPFEAELLRVVDGDTIEARVRIWFGQEIATLVRIRGIDAPELHARCAEEAQGAQAARDYLARFLRNKNISLRDVGMDKYGGRVLASISVSDGRSTQDISTIMLTQGLARPYQGGKRQSWCGH